MLMLAKEVTSR